MDSTHNLLYMDSPTPKEEDYFQQFKPIERKRTNKGKLALIFGVVVLVIAAIVVGVLFGVKKKSETSSSPSAPVGPVNGTVNVALSSTAPNTAISLSPTLFSISIEQDRWPEWVGSDTPNSYFINLLDNVKAITGTPVSIRIGADSEDVTKFDASVEVSEIVFPPITLEDPYPEAQNISVSDGFYNLVSRLPEDTVVTWGVPLKSANITSTYLNAKAIMKTFASQEVKSKNITLKYLEVGNEPDYYAHHGARNKSWDVAAYVKQWSQYASNVSAATGLVAGTEPSILGGSFANTTHSEHAFSPMTLLGAGILSTGPGSLIKTYSQHYYTGNFCKGKSGLTQDLMDKSTIRENLDAFKPDIATVKSNGLEYIFGETNSYACHGAPNVSNAAGAAVFLLDYGMYAAQLGVSQLYIHNGIGYKYNLIQPVSLNRSILDGSPISPSLPPHIQPPYYAMIVAAEAIGKSNAVTAVELNLDAPRVAGYAFYESGKLVRALLINSNAYLSTDGGPDTRPSILVQLGLDDATASTTMTVKRLSIQHADDTSGVTWGGQTYETTNGLVEGTLNVETIPVSSGFYIAATEVILLSFQ